MNFEKNNQDVLTNNFIFSYYKDTSLVLIFCREENSLIIFKEETYPRNIAPFVGKALRVTIPKPRVKTPSPSFL